MECKVSVYLLINDFPTTLNTQERSNANQIRCNLRILILFSKDSFKVFINKSNFPALGTNANEFNSNIIQRNF